MDWLGGRSGFRLRGVVMCTCALVWGCAETTVTKGGGGSSQGDSGDTEAGDPPAEGSSDESGTETGDPPKEPIDPFEGAHLVRGGAPYGARTFGDFDGDGDDDIAISYVAELVQQHVVGIYGYDAESDAFEFLMQPESGRVATSLAAGHVDGNAQLDLISLWSGYGNSAAQLAIHGSEIESGPTIDFAGGRLGLPIDFDGDRRSELLEIRGRDIVLHEVDLAGGWDEIQTLESPSGCTPRGSAWEDLDGDGSPEVSVVSECDGGGGQLTVYTQTDDGLLRNLSSKDLEIPGHGVRLADVDQDGIVDVLVTSSRYSEEQALPLGQLHRGVGDGSFDALLLELDTPDLAYEPYGEFQLITADIDGDGIPEAITASWGTPWTESMDPSRNYLVSVGAELHLDLVPFDESFANAADINGDGCEDLVGEGLTTLFMACN